MDLGFMANILEAMKGKKICGFSEQMKSLMTLFQ